VSPPLYDLVVEWRLRTSPHLRRSASVADDPGLHRDHDPQPLHAGGAKQVAKHAFDAGFWPGWERVDSAGRKVAGEVPPTRSKEN
jgi:hypothetical protein